MNWSEVYGYDAVEPKHVQSDAITALRELESACDGVAATRSQGTYLRMVDVDGATDALERLDCARRVAREVLKKEGESD